MLTDLELLTAELEACHDDPERFQDHLLGRRLWSKQVEVCRAVARSPVTVVPAGRAVGKSFLLAGLVLWWLYTRPMSLIITTGPDHRQVVSVLWKEIRRAMKDAPIELGFDHLSQGYTSPQRLTVAEGSDWSVLGFAAQKEEGFGGQHAGELLVIVDEASGIQPPIWSAIHGLASTRLVVVGNPIRYDCHFRELHDLAVKGSTTITSVGISSLESPDATKDSSPVGLASRSFLNQMREIHGEDSPWWRSNIIGIFPGAESVRFLPAVWLNACTRESTLSDELWRDYPAGPAVMGVDIGGGVGADRSVVVVRNRKRILEIFASEWHGVLDDAKHRLEPIVLDLARKWNVTPSRVVYDKGGLGRNFASYVAKESEKYRERWWASQTDIIITKDEVPERFEPIFGYFGASKGGRLYVNRRTANAFALRRRLDPHREDHVPFYCGGIPQWPDLYQELDALKLTDSETEDGHVKERLEDKADMMARLHRSPDFLDALLMTFTFSE